MFTFGSENIKDTEPLNIKYLMLGMRDQIDCDLTFYTYAAIEFIEEALKLTNNKAKILVHCYKV